MAEIFDLLARVSWDTNTQELQAMNTELSKEDKILNELRHKGIRLEQQQKQVHDPKKVQSMNAALAQNKKAQDTIIAAQKEQIKQTELLRQKQQQLAAQITRTSDPNALRGLVTGMKSVSTELASAGKAAGGFMAALGVGVGAFGVQAAVQALVGGLQDSLNEIIEAERATRNLGLALDATGKGRYLEGLTKEAEGLAKQFGNIFDNDEIVAAQTELVKYGRVTRSELSDLTKIAIELAAKTGTDVPTAANKLVDILAGRGAATLRDFGLSLKGAQTEGERMGIVMTDLAEKVSGASAVYAQSAEGMRRQNELIIANAKENIGAKLLPIYADFLSGLNSLLQGDFNDVMLFMSGQGAVVKARQIRQQRVDAEVAAITQDIDRLEKAIFQARKFGAAEPVIMALRMQLEDLRAAKQDRQKISNLPPEDVAEQNVKKIAQAGKKEAAKKENTVRINVELTRLTPTGAPAATATEGITGSMDAADRMIQQKAALDNIRLIEQDAKKRREENARADREELYNNLIDAANVANSLIAIEQQKTDRLIELQQKRVDAARDSSKVSLKIEEDRLNALLEKRRKHEQAQRVIDAAIIVANNALTVSNAVTAAVAGFKSGNIALGVANVVAIAAAIAASVAAVKSATTDTGFKEGGYTGDGDPSQESRTLGRKPYKYHKGEYVMDAELTAKNRDLFEGIHQRRLKVRQLDDGKYYIAPDVDKMAEDYQNAKYSTQDGQVLAELSAMRRMLAQREVNVQNNFDADGFGQAVATQMGHIHLKNLRRN